MRDKWGVDSRESDYAVDHQQADMSLGGNFTPQPSAG
jgi:hypothetical protein